MVHALFRTTALVILLGASTLGSSALAHEESYGGSYGGSNGGYYGGPYGKSAFSTTLSGANEVPPVASNGSGTAVVTLSDALDNMDIRVSFANLSGSSTAAHIHCCAPLGTNADVATAVPTFPDFPLGVTEGSYARTFNLLDPSTYNPAFVTANGGTVEGARNALVGGLQNGTSYFNLHSTLYPGGEIRGQLVAVAAPIPEPETWAMMIVSLALLGGMRFWRSIGGVRRLVPA
ncbi:CHRD domain-containing protein [Sphingomonas oleivorans]|nr:CHRD domain-containing protein [Sphingomonas oleivorans]